ncbi:metal-dependent transcriptional regulator [archaeon]|jgi:DtxR family transcriptional regulator, Mn-dependent transcriptional regulator|nr:metal-dependent transcriptional regulator [archaeon]MBT4352203.1 metal-dependent transcriptional regulator [archaeon]MBT4647326.1 metal-dependent transcriptional regulator [archaeon]MBT6821238.1 metal-dependent transcriptional regulator [archaeon]MBT7391290.1 metal-dependent transcriptional regulator [archaeon]
MAKRLHKNQKERISTDMYLKSILEYELDNGKKSKPIEIVKSLNLTKGSVSEMIKKLEEENYIKYESYGEINLTEKGLKRAKNVKKKYVVIKKFLDEVLKFDTSKSHIEACNLEHAFSDESITKLNTLLKFLEKNK